MFSQEIVIGRMITSGEINYYIEETGEGQQFMIGYSITMCLINAIVPIQMPVCSGTVKAIQARPHQTAGLVTVHSFVSTFFCQDV